MVTCGGKNRAGSRIWLRAVASRRRRQCRLAAASPDARALPVFSDLICPFAHVTIHRRFTTRIRLASTTRSASDTTPFPIELLKATPGTRHGFDSEIPAPGTLEPAADGNCRRAPTTNTRAPFCSPSKPGKPPPLSHYRSARGTKERCGTGRNVRWQEGWASGFPVIDRDEAGTIDTLLQTQPPRVPIRSCRRYRAGKDSRQRALSGQTTRDTGRKFGSSGIVVVALER